MSEIAPQDDHNWREPEPEEEPELVTDPRIKWTTGTSSGRVQRGSMTGMDIYEFSDSVQAIVPTPIIVCCKCEIWRHSDPTNRHNNQLFYEVWVSKPDNKPGSVGVDGGLIQGTILSGPDPGAILDDLRALFP